MHATCDMWYVVSCTDVKVLVSYRISVAKAGLKVEASPTHPSPPPHRDTTTNGPTEKARWNPAGGRKHAMNRRRSAVPAEPKIRNVQWTALCRQLVGTPMG